ncbi:MAG: hypothetical protein IKR85_06510 [Clostridia bacterium]|nr:hypothetical protein [Clostridia bacterium]
MLWTRDEYLSHMTFAGSPREMFTELFGPLIGLDAEWRSQGASEDEISLTAFGWDAVKYVTVPFDISPHTGLSEKLISENDTERISVDALGRRMRLSKKCATIPLPFSWPVQTPESWDAVRHWYAFDDSRIDMPSLKRAARARDEGALSIMWIPGGFDEPRQLMGEEEVCCAFIEEPEMIEDMLGTLGDMCVQALERILDTVPVDILCIHEDMAGKSGPMIGPKLVRRFLTPYYRRVWNIAKGAGAKLFSQDSDGNMEAVIDEFLDAGINCMYPLEPMAGMDMVKLRQKYGSRLAFKGGIDKFALRGTKEDIRRELEYKLASPLTGGGTVFGLDHRIPNGVPIENYRYYVKLGRELLGLPPAKPGKHIRMAF